jgi:hypothetical protein
VPPPSSVPRFNDDFSSARLGSPPPGWQVHYGSWRVAALPERVLANGQYRGMISAGSPSWTDYQTVALVQPIAWAPGALGVAFRYVDADNYYSCEVRNNRMLYLSRYLNGAWTQLGYASVDAPGGAWVSVTAAARGNRLSCSLNGRLLVSSTDPSFGAGKIAFVSNNYGNFGRVTVSP